MKRLLLFLALSLSPHAVQAAEFVGTPLRFDAAAFRQMFPFLIGSDNIQFLVKPTQSGFTGMAIEVDILEDGVVTHCVDSTRDTPETQRRLFACMVKSAKTAVILKAEAFETFDGPRTLKTDFPPPPAQ